MLFRSDFYLKYPDLAISKNKQSDFDTKYSYFHWVPNYNFYSSILAGLLARGLIKVEEGNYSITNLGNDFFCKMHNKYIEQVVASSEYIILKICKLSNQSIINEINLLIYNERGL